MTSKDGDDNRNSLQSEDIKTTLEKYVNIYIYQIIQIKIDLVFVENIWKNTCLFNITCNAWKINKKIIQNY